MCLTGSLAEFPLSEILQFLEKGQKTGTLMLRLLPEAEATLPPVHYIWIYQGRLVAIANRSDQQGLVSLIEKLLGLSNRVVAKLAQLCPIDQPLGVYLKNQGLLHTEHLKYLFYIQVVQQVFALFQVKTGEFKFYPSERLEMREMTGLSVPLGVLNQYSSMRILIGEINNCCLNSKSLLVCPH